MTREEVLSSMLHSGLRNYIAPGLFSHLVGDGTAKYGKVRLFAAERETRDSITPHSHRFAFTCMVLSGSVRNTIYNPDGSIYSDLYIRSEITQVCGKNGLLNFVHNREVEPHGYSRTTTVYQAGQWYTLSKNDIHSITFTKGTQVLFLEGPEESHTDYMLEPWVDGKLVPTFRTEPWMFEKL